MAEVPRYRKHIRVLPPQDGVVHVEIDVPAYGITGRHWKEQLTAPDVQKWGRIFIDVDREEKRLRRRDAIGAFRGLYRGHAGANIDECPGAMFIWESQEIAHPLPVDAVSNQELGRDLYHALRAAISGPMEWYEVRFSFAG